MAEEAPPDYGALPLTEKLSHKVWKARSLGYEEAAKLFKRIDDEKSSEYSKFTGLIKKFVTDTNALAQDKGLDAALAFVEYAAAAAKVTAEVVEGVVIKCLNQKPKTKEKGTLICLMFIEIEQAAAVQEELMKGFENKQPKIVAACVEILTRGIREFGPKVINIKLLMKVLPKIFEHSDKNVREQAKGLATELFRWLRDAVKPSLSSLKPVQLKELEDSWAALPSDPARPTRLLRSQQARAAEEPSAATAASGEDAGEVEVAGAEEIDPYDLIEATAVLEKLPKDFFEKVVEKKWQDRKEALDALLEIVSQPKLAAGTYGDLLQALKKVVTKDTNVMLVALGAKCVALLAVGLRKGFAQYVGLLFAPFLEKFKEKKAAVVAALRDALDAMLAAVTVQLQIEDILTVGLESKNPAVKAETIMLLTRSFCKSSPAMVPKPMLKQLCPVLMKKFDDTTPLVRDATAECLGTLQKLLGERAMTAYFADLDKARSAKVNEAAEKAEITPPKGSAAPAKKAAPPAKASAAAAATGGEDSASLVADEPKAPVKKRPALSSDRRKAAKAVEGAEEPAGDSKPKDAEPAKAAAPPARKPPMKKAATSKPAAKPSGASASGGKPKAASSKGGDGGAFKEPEGPPEPAIAAEELEEKAAAVFPAELLTALDSKAWKERLQAYEDLVTALKGMTETHTYLAVKLMAKKPGWKDTNFQVMKAKFETIVYLAQNTPFGKKSAQCAFPGLVDKLADIKVKTVACEALSAIGEALSLNYVSLHVSKLALEHKSPKVQQEALTWLNVALREFGLAINIKPHIDYIKTCLGATNPGVRTAAINLLGTAHLFLGGQLRMFFEEEKPALLAQIDAEFEKRKDETAPVPTRGAKAGEDPSAAGGGGGGGAAASLADLMPRNDISGQITSGLIAELADKQWKVRGEALTKVADIISAAKFITPALGDLPGALKGRLADTNKNLVVTTLNILASIATAMGPAVKKYLPVLGSAIIHVLSDAKPQVRAAAVACLNAYCQEVKLNAFLEGGYITTGVATENPNLRGELLVWLEQKLGEAGSVSSEIKEVAVPLYACLEDRSGDIRKKAQLVVPALIGHIGIEYMLKATGKLKGSSKQTVVALLEKHRGASAPAAAATSSGEAVTAGKSSAKSGASAKGQSKSAPGKKAPTASSSSARPAPATTSSAAAAANGDEDGPPLTSHGGKEARMKDEKNNKTLKWNFTAPRPEYLEQLKEQLMPCLSKKQFTEMFHADFKHHIIGLDALIKVATPDASGTAAQQDETVATLDLLLRWISLRFFDTNTSVLLKALEYLACVFRMLSQLNHHLSEYEASAFIPYLVQKVGDAKDPVRKAVRGLFQLVCDVYPASKMYVYIMDGTQSKNSRQRIECLEEITCLVERHTLNVCQPSVPKAVSALSSLISDRDNSVRSATLNALVGVYVQLEEAAFWKYVGSVSEKEKSLLEERIRRSGKKPAGSAAPPASKAPSAAESRASKLPASGAAAEKKPLGGLRAPQGRSGIALPSSSTSSTASAPAATALPKAPATNPSKVLGVVHGEFFSIDVSGAEFTVDPNVVPPVQLQTVADLDQVLKPYEVPSRLASRLGHRLQGASTSGALAAMSSPVSVSTRPMSDTGVRSIGMPSSNSLTASVPSQVRPVTASPPSSLDGLLRQLTSAQLPTAIQALRELESQMQIGEVVQSLSARVDDLLLSLAQQLQIACSIHAIRCKGDSPDELMRLLKYIVHIQVIILQQPSLAQAVSRRGLTQLLWQLLASLKDESLLRLPDISQLHRTVNILFVRYFEMCRPNETLGSVIELLGQCVQEGSSRANLTELVLKCLWRLTRMLDKLLETCQLDRLFLDLHNFLVMHPSSVWRQRPNNIPLRSIKTIIHHVAEKVGPRLMDHLSLVSNSDESELVLFLQKRLAMGGAAAASAATKAEVPSSVPMARTAVSQAAPDGEEPRLRNPLALSSRDNVTTPPATTETPPPVEAATTPGDVTNAPVISLSSTASPSRPTTPLSSAARQQLADIVSKIGDRENSQCGLQELYEFLQSHPDAHIAPYFDLCSPEFRSFVEKSLRNIARQRARDAKAAGTNLQENVYSAKGVPSTGNVGGAAADKTSSPDALQATQAAAKSNQDTLANFRKRLERIKDSSNP